MRNLKRALSLTLASVMLLGMMVVGSSAAAGYDDVAETDNVEAIEVLQAIEVMVGDERGFGPERPVNRAEMAVVMGKLLSLDYNYYTATCPFNDVYDWARGWVGACAANGIVSGRGEGVYDPGATVTAVEAASMLMRALGYFKYQNDYADGFEVSTVRQGTKIGIFNGVGSSATEPMTRNQVAQMVLNALQSAVVEPDGNTINLTTPDGTVYTGKVNYVSVTSAKSFATAISRTQATSVGSQNDGWIVELGERLYDGKLKLTDTTDDFGRPSRYWEYDAKEIGTYVKEELIRQEYTVKVTGRTLHDLLGSTILKDYDLDVYIDGVDDPAINTAVFGANSLVRNNENGVGKTGKGVLTQVFVDPDEGSNGLITIAIINTYLAIADEDFDDRTDDLDITVYGIEPISGYPNLYEKTASIGTKAAGPTDESSAFKLETEDFPSIVDAKDGDAYLVTVADGKVQTIAKPEIISGTQITSFKQADWIVTGGTQYDFASAAEFEMDTLYDYTATDNAVINLKDITYNVYLDKYGYAIGVEEVERVENYVFITGVDTNTVNRYAVQADASAIFVDGTMDAIKVDMKAARDLTNQATYRALTGADADEEIKNIKGGSLINKWFSYTVGNDGVYEVVLVGDDNDVENNGARAGQFRTLNKKDDNINNTASAPYYALGGVHGVDEIGPKSIALRGADEANSAYYSVYGDDQSVYITTELETIIDANGNEKYQVNIISGVDNVVTGIDNASIDVWTKATAKTRGDSKITADVTAYGSYVLYDDDGDIIAAVVVGEDSGAVTNLVYTHKSSIESETDNNAADSRATVKGDYTWTRKVVSNGEEILLTEVGSGLSKLKSMQDHTWYVVKYNAKGEVKNVYPAWDTATYQYGYKGLIDAEPTGDTATPVVKEKTRTEDQYVNNIEELNAATNENGMVLFEVGKYNAGRYANRFSNTVVRTSQYDIDSVGSVSYLGGPNNPENVRMSGKPYVDNHTLYITTQTNTGLHRGFRVADDVKTVFIQTNNREETTLFESGYSRLEKVIDRLHDHAEYGEFSNTAERNNYHYEISAVMENGKASVVVIRDLNNAGATWGTVDRNRELRLYGNLFTSPTTVTGASNAVVTVGDKVIEPTGIGTDRYGSYTIYSIPQNNVVAITDYDIDDVTPAFTWMSNMPSSNLRVRYLNRTMTFEMPDYNVWIDGGRGTSFVEDIIGRTDKTEASLTNKTVTFNNLADGSKLEDQTYGSPISVVITQTLGRAASITLVDGETYTVTLGDPKASWTGKATKNADGAVQLVFTYYLTGNDIRNGEVVVYSIVAANGGTTDPTDPVDPSTPSHNITVTKPTNGTVSTSPADTAKEGATVTVTATPADKYELDKITVTGKDGTAITVTGNTFTMPKQDVTVTVTFKEKDDSSVTPAPASKEYFAELNTSSGKYEFWSYKEKALTEAQVLGALKEATKADSVEFMNGLTGGQAIVKTGTSSKVINYVTGSAAKSKSYLKPDELVKISYKGTAVDYVKLSGDTVEGFPAKVLKLLKDTTLQTATVDATTDAKGKITGVTYTTKVDVNYVDAVEIKGDASVGTTWQVFDTAADDWENPASNKFVQAGAKVRFTEANATAKGTKSQLYVNDVAVGDAKVGTDGTTKLKFTVDSLTGNEKGEANIKISAEYAITVNGKPVTPVNGVIAVKDLGLKVGDVLVAVTDTQDADGNDVAQYWCADGKKVSVTADSYGDPIIAVTAAVSGGVRANGSIELISGVVVNNSGLAIAPVKFNGTKTKELAVATNNVVAKDAVVTLTGAKPKTYLGVTIGTSDQQVVGNYATYDAPTYDVTIGTEDVVVVEVARIALKFKNNDTADNAFGKDKTTADVALVDDSSTGVTGTLKTEIKNTDGSEAPATLEGNTSYKVILTGLSVSAGKTAKGFDISKDLTLADGLKQSADAVVEVDENGALTITLTLKTEA